MRQCTTQSGPILVLLTRPSDSLCSLIQTWAMTQHWGDLMLCHSLYDIEARLDDINPQQPVILIARPSILNTEFLSSVLIRRKSLRLIGWIQPQQSSSTQLTAISSRVPIVTVGNTEQLTNIINNFQMTTQSEQIPVAAVPENTMNSCIDPEQYRLSNDEIDALLGAE